MAPKPKHDAQEEPKPRTFRLRAPAEGTPDDEVVTRVSFGESPPVSIGTDETFTTEDAKVAERCAAQPLLEEVTGA